MQNFEYHRATSAENAIALRAEGDDATYLAGGMTLLPTMKQGLAAPSDVVDLSAAALNGISVTDDAVTIGAMTRHAEVAGSVEVIAAIPALAALAGGIGDRQVRNRGTLGGSVANNDPTADYPAACLALDATIITNAREIAADDFFVGMFETALDDGELLQAVRFPRVTRAAYMKFPNPASRYALVGVMVAQSEAGVRVAVTGAGQDGVFRVPEMEAGLSKSFDAAAIDGVTISADDLNSDIHASADYRAHIVGVMAKRAVAAAA